MRMRRGAGESTSPSQALSRQIPPFVTYGDIFPRSGGSLSSKGEPLAVHTSFISLPRPLPLGEVDANAVSRRRGRARCPSEHVRLLKRFILYFFRSAVQSFRNFFDFSQKCNDFFRKIGYTVSCRDSGAATTSPHMIPPHTKQYPKQEPPPVYRKRRREFLFASAFVFYDFLQSKERFLCLN